MEIPKINEPQHITNITYQDFDPDIYYYITYPGVKEKLYAINIFGEIISLDKNREKKRKPEFSKGYFRIKLRTPDMKAKSFIVSRLVAWEFVGQPENYKKLEVNHADGLKVNNNYKNLEWCTTEENSIHKVIYGLAAQSEYHGYNNHKEVVVRFIIKEMKKNKSAPEIATKVLKKFPQYYSDKTKYDYDRIRGLVSKIKRGISWYNIKNEIEGSTTIENIKYEKHIGDKVSRVGLHPIPARKSGHLKESLDEDIV